MSDSNKEISLIDLIEYYEPGPVLKERTPDLNRVSFHPGDGEHYDGDDAPPAGKSITSSTRSRWLSKKALGLTDVPIHGTPGNIGAFRQRDEYGEGDEEAQFTTGFGGPSELDNFLEKEDKSPTNISRKLNADKKLKTLGDLDKMSFQKSELLKLAKALRFRGHNNFADSITKLAEGERTEDELEASHRVFTALRNMYGTFEPFDINIRNKWSKSKIYREGRPEDRPKPNQELINSTYDALIDYWNRQDLSAGGGGQPNADDMNRNIEFLNAAKGGVINYDEFITSMWNEGKGGYATSGAVGFTPFNPFESRNEFDAAVAAEVKLFKLAWEAVTDYSNTYYPSSEGGEAAPSEGGAAAPSEGGAAAPSEGGGSTTQKKIKVQMKINEVFRGPLLPRVKDNYLVDAEGNQMADSRGNPVAIPIGEDGKFGPQTTAAFNAATNKNYAPYKWPITDDAAYTMLDSITADTPADTAPAEGTPVEGEAPGEAGAGETDAGEGEGAIVSGDGRVRYMTREEFGVDYWIAQSPQYRGQIVGVGKSGTSVAGDIVFMDGRFSETTYNGERLVRPSDQHALVMPVEAREGRNFPGQPQTLTAREKRKLLDVIRPNVEKEELKSFRRILGGSIQEGRTGGFTSRRSRARGQKRQDRGRSEIR